MIRYRLLEVNDDFPMPVFEVKTDEGYHLAINDLGKFTIVWSSVEMTDHEKVVLEHDLTTAIIG